MVTAPSHVVLLGAQRPSRTLGAAVSELGVKGRVALVTAGWKEREGEDAELSQDLGGRTMNLRLYGRTEELFVADPELARAYRERQQRLRERMDFYRVRLAHVREADLVIRHRRAPPAVLADEARASIDAIRALDAWHLARCREHHRAFEEAVDLGARAEVIRQRREVAAVLDGCDALAIAGGHVATLRNRLALFDFGRVVGARPVFAWSGGAMVATGKVVLFHDDPPQGPAESEVMDEGLDLLAGVVAFPEPERRLELGRTERVAVLAQRFLPARAVALPAGARVTFFAGRVARTVGALELLPSGEHAPLAEEATP
jgi:hypothetical protein